MAGNVNFAKMIEQELAAVDAELDGFQFAAEKAKRLRALQELYARPTPKKAPPRSESRSTGRGTESGQKEERPAVHRKEDPVPADQQSPETAAASLDPPGSSDGPARTPMGESDASPSPTQEPGPQDQPRSMDHAPAIATTVMSVERRPGPVATPIRSDEMIRLPTEEQLRGQR